MPKNLDHAEHADRFMPIEAVVRLDQAAKYPPVTCALAELSGATLQFDERCPNSDRPGGVNADVIALSPRFAMLMREYQQSI